MKSVNKVTLIGNIGNDPELRATATNSILSFPLATSKKWKGNDGEMHEETQWHKIICFGKLAELGEKYFLKGKPLFIEGEIRYRSWEADGVTKYTTEIIANEVILLGGRD